MEEHTIIMIDEMGCLGSALGKMFGDGGSLGIVAVETVAYERVKTVLQAAEQRKDGRSELVFNSRLTVAIGINVNVLKRRTSSERAKCFGSDLFEWLRLKQRISIPVVLWSFLDEERLRKEGPPALRLPKGHVFVRLPASLQELGDAFHQVLKDENRLSREELETMLAELYGSAVAQFNPFLLMDRQLFEKIAEEAAKLGGGLADLEADLSGACRSLAEGNEASLEAILDAPAWTAVRKSAVGLDRSLRIKGSRVAEIKKLSKSAVALGSFSRWKEAKRQIDDVNWENAGEFYLEQLQIFKNTLDRMHEQLADAQRERDT